MNLPKFLVFSPRLQNFLWKRYTSFFKPIEHEKPNNSIRVTIIGANSKTGQILALLLKQCPQINELRLFDFSRGPCGTALDLSHIDTNTRVESYTGLEMLGAAITDSTVVAICGGESTKPAETEFVLFKRNADYVRSIALYATEFCPKSILCISTPPIAAMVPLISEEYKKAEVYDSRKIIGVSTLAVVRANSIVADHTDQDPCSVMCPIVGALGAKTTVPVVSQTATGAKLPSPVADVLRNKIARAEEDVLKVKYVENAGGCCISPAFATARFITSVVRGVLGHFDGAECAFVPQTEHARNFLPYMTSIVKLGKYGIQSVHMPHLDNSECMLLQRAAAVIRQQIAWGESYVTGALIRKKRRCIRTAPPCPVIQIQNVTHVGDVSFNPTSEDKKIKNQAEFVPKM